MTLVRTTMSEDGTAAADTVRENGSVLATAVAQHADAAYGDRVEVIIPGEGRTLFDPHQARAIGAALTAFFRRADGETDLVGGMIEVQDGVGDDPEGSTVEFEENEHGEWIFRMKRRNGEQIDRASETYTELRGAQHAAALTYGPLRFARMQTKVLRHAE